MHVVQLCRPRYRGRADKWASGAQSGCRRSVAGPISRMLERLRKWAGNLKLDVVAFWLAARDPQVPWYAKAIAAAVAVAACALSPVDVIPDFVPVFGFLDDLVIVLIGIWVALRLVPKPAMRPRASAGPWDGYRSPACCLTGVGGRGSSWRRMYWCAKLLVRSRPCCSRSAGSSCHARGPPAL